MCVTKLQGSNSTCRTCIKVKERPGLRDWGPSEGWSHTQRLWAGQPLQMFIVSQQRSSGCQEALCFSPDHTDYKISLDMTNMWHVTTTSYTKLCINVSTGFNYCISGNIVQNCALVSLTRPLKSSANLFNVEQMLNKQNVKLYEKCCTKSFWSSSGVRFPTGPIRGRIIQQDETNYIQSNEERYANIHTATDRLGYILSRHEQWNCFPSCRKAVTHRTPGRHPPVRLCSLCYLIPVVGTDIDNQTTLCLC